MRIFQPDRVLLASFVERMAPRMHGTVIDVGGGNRRYANLFTHCTYKTVDHDPAQHPDYVASIDLLPLPDTSVDGILCTQVLGDVEDPKKAIEEMARVLKSGGKLLLTESLFNEEHDMPHDYWRFTEEAYRFLLNNHFVIDVLEERGGYFSQIAQQKIRYMIERFDAYHRPLVGRVIHLWALGIGKIAMMLDRKNCLQKRFTIGHCILATKR